MTPEEIKDEMEKCMDVKYFMENYWLVNGEKFMSRDLIGCIPTHKSDRMLAFEYSLIVQKKLDEWFRSLPLFLHQKSLPEGRG